MIAGKNMLNVTAAFSATFFGRNDDGGGLAQDLIMTGIGMVLTLHLIWVINQFMTRMDKQSNYPSYLPRPQIQWKKYRNSTTSNIKKHDTNGNTAAGILETTLAITHPKGPFFLYDGMKQISSKWGKHGSPRWIARLNIPTMKPSKISVIVGDADIAREILKHGKSIKPAIYKEFEQATGGYPTLFTENGERWKHGRVGMAPAFASQHIKRMNDICAKQLNIWITNTLNPMVEHGEAFDVVKEMISLTLNVICEAAFEYDISIEEMNSFLLHLEIASREFIMMNPLHKYFPFLFPQVWKAKRSAQALMDLAHRIMENYRQQSARKKANNDFEEDTILKRIMENSNYECENERAADVISLLVAGYDSTSCTISWLLLNLARYNPPELATYRKKAAKLPKEEWGRIDELQYIIKEGMRLNPMAAIGSMRLAGKDVTYRDPTSSSSEDIIIPKDSFVLLNYFSMFRNPEYYDDPDKFLPSRWANASKDEEQNNRMNQALIPFSLGHRNCVGQSLANAEMQTVLAVLCAQFDFAIEDEGSYEYFLTYKPVGAKLIPRKAPQPRED